MMTSKSILLFASLVAMAIASAEEIPSAEARNYYQFKFADAPEGVYEWDERDLIFVQVRIPTSEARSVEKIESAEMGATKRMLRKWIESKAAMRRVDPIFPLGFDSVRKTCREFLPSLEYASDWKFSGESCAFTRDDGDERITATVFRKSELLESIPESYVKATAEGFWLKGLRELFKRASGTTKFQNLVFEIGALDCLAHGSKQLNSFPDWKNTAFKDVHREFLRMSVEPMRGTKSVSAQEYDEVNQQIETYLLESERGTAYLSAALSLVKPFPREGRIVKDNGVHETTNIVCRVCTNKIERCQVVTNVVNVDSMCADGGVAALGNTLRRECVVVESEVEREVITQTIVRHVDRIIAKTYTMDFGQPRFEELFLGGGYVENTPSKHTRRGNDAIKVFYGKASLEDRERTIVSALRENPGDKELWNLCGRVFGARNDHYGAIVCYRNALKLDALYEFALVNLALEYSALGKGRLAVGTAMVVQGLSSDSWCLKQAEVILRKKW